MYLLEEIKNFDAIEINKDTKKDMCKTLKDKFHIYPEYYLNEGIIRYIEFAENFDLYLYFKHESKFIIKLESYMHDKLENEFVFLLTITIDISKADPYSYTFFKPIDCKLNTILQRKPEYWMMDINIAVSHYAIVLIYMSYINRNPKYRSKMKKIKDINSSNHIVKNKNIQKRIINIAGVKIKTSNQRFITNLTTRKYQKHIFTWNVMGHHRHYKDGNTVFIKPYIKGDKNKELTPKIYKIDN